MWEILWLLTKIILVLGILLVAGFILALLSPIRARFKGWCDLPEQAKPGARVKVTWVYGLVAFTLQAVTDGVTRELRVAGFKVDLDDDDPPPLDVASTLEVASFDLALFGFDPGDGEDDDEDRDDSEGRDYSATEPVLDQKESNRHQAEKKEGRLAPVRKALAFLRQHKRLISDLIRALWIFFRDFIRSFSLRLHSFRLDISLADVALLGQICGTAAVLKATKPDLFSAMEVIPDFEILHDDIDMETRGELRLSMVNLFLSGTKFLLRPCVWKAAWMGFKEWRKRAKEEQF